ncbi:hypothetical protein [Paenibacillus sp. MMS20-IR301]|uniref:hypothetical protein n=1 Tax=Paenibacillus sp. MMS20-IR301 TaxID=2895946 RepID=UPI0028E519EE|nr:hypothetical protein [Paenibacillus sp. MMS20-IR301]WNS46083.1 hypothetical protein LOS79_12670 [Paenibacillus sp. MMS20-IR301]
MSLLRYYLTELKLLLRGPSLYLMLAGMGAILYLMIRTTGAALDRAVFVMDISRVYCKVAIIILPLLAISIARRDEEWKTSSMVSAFPYRIWEMEAARLLCAATLPLAAALVPAGTYVWLVFKDGITWGMREWYTSAVFASFTIPVLLATVIAYLTGILIRKRYSYLIGFVLLLGLTIIVPELTGGTSSYALPPYSQVWLDYSLINHIGDSYSRLWGFLYDPAFWLHRGMVAALAAGIALIAVIVMYRRRRERIRGWLISPVMLALGAVLLWAGSAMYGHLQERVEAADANEEFYRERLASTNTTMQQRALEQLFVAGAEAGKYTEPDIEEMSRAGINKADTDEQMQEAYIAMGGIPESQLPASHMKDLLTGMKFRKLLINSYKLELELLPHHELKIEATMQARNGQAEKLGRFPVMLRHLFDIEELKVNGAAADYEWEKAADVLWITPDADIMPGGQLEITMSYSGTINDWRHYSYYFPGKDLWEQAAVVADNRLFLPSFYGWYPVIGNGRLSELLTNSGYTEEGRATNILDTYLPHPMAGFEVDVKGPGSLKLFSNASVIDSEQGEERGITVTRLQLNEASGLTLFGGDLQLAEASSGGKTVRLLASGQLPVRAVEEAAQLAASQYAEAERTLNRLDGEAAADFPRTVTMALADHPNYILNQLPLRTSGMVNAMEGPEARDIHYLSAYGYFGADIEQGTSGEIHLRTGQYWLDYSAERRAGSSGRLTYFNTQFILNNLFQAYNERKLAGEESRGLLFDPVGKYFLDSQANQVYDLINTIYSQHGIESVYEVLKLIYDSIGTEQLNKDSDAQIEELLRGYLQRKTEGSR